jgi:4-amino-4-deoxy-L-arabinose transferase-like glycosyltransferase
MVPPRCWHYALIALVWAVSGLPNLGGPSLWDIDEGNNAEAAREMLLSGDWVVPCFNYQLREDKPALLYWCQIYAYRTFGVNEFAARFPSAIASLLASLVVYELGRAMFSLAAGLLAGLALPTCLLFCAAGHFANPDALLALSLTLAYAFFWAWDRGHTWAALPMGLSIGLGVMAKGPVALVLPLVVWTLYLFWQRRLWRAWRPGFILGLASWVLVAAPWYVWVTVETHGAWLAGFWYRHNQGRFLSPMESHSGPIFYYLPILILGLAPWSFFLAHVLHDAVRRVRKPAEQDEDIRRKDATRYLLVWALVYVGFFSFAATKLPNYVLPIYPSLILLIAARVERWRQGERLPRWVVPAGVVGVFLVGVGLLVGPLIAAGTLAPNLLAGKHMPGVEIAAVLAVFPLLTVVLCVWFYRRGEVSRFLTSFVVLATMTTAITAAWGPTLLEPHKAIKSLAREMPPDHLDRDVRVVVLDYFQPSLVFYTQRVVEFVPSREAVEEVLRGPEPAYVLLSRERWDEIHAQFPGTGREVARRTDLYRRVEVVMVTNDPLGTASVNERTPGVSPR